MGGAERRPEEGCGEAYTALRVRQRRKAASCVGHHRQGHARRLRAEPPVRLGGEGRLELGLEGRGTVRAPDTQRQGKARLLGVRRLPPGRRQAMCRDGRIFTGVYFQKRKVTRL